MNNYNYNWYYMNRNNSYNENQQENLFSPNEGFIKGNMFSNLYNRYKNYNAKDIVPRSEQEKKLLEIQKIAFAIHDLNLYLDTHPTDQSMFMLMQDYLRKKDALVQEYESEFGPLMVSGVVNSNNFNWVSKRWPWEVKDV